MCTPVAEFEELELASIYLLPKIEGEGDINKLIVKNKGIK